VSHLIEMIVGHVLGELDPPGLQQAHRDEVAVPPVHLVEAPAGDDVGMRQIEQPVWIDCAHVLARIFREHPQVYLRPLLGRQRPAEALAHRGGVLAGSHVEGPGRAGLVVNLLVGQGGEQVAVRAGEGDPGGVDVGPEGVEALRRRQRNSGGGVGERLGNNGPGTAPQNHEK